MVDLSRLEAREVAPTAGTTERVRTDKYAGLGTLLSGVADLAEAGQNFVALKKEREAQAKLAEARQMNTDIDLAFLQGSSSEELSQLVHGVSADLDSLDDDTGIGDTDLNQLRQAIADRDRFENARQQGLGNLAIDMARSLALRRMKMNNPALSAEFDKIFGSDNISTRLTASLKEDESTQTPEEKFQQEQREAYAKNVSALFPDLRDMSTKEVHRLRSSDPRLIRYDTSVQNVAQMKLEAEEGGMRDSVAYQDYKDQVLNAAPLVLIPHLEDELGRYNLEIPEGRVAAQQAIARIRRSEMAKHGIVASRNGKSASFATDFQPMDEIFGLYETLASGAAGSKEAQAQLDMIKALQESKFLAANQQVSALRTLADIANNLGPSAQLDVRAAMQRPGGRAVFDGLLASALGVTPLDPLDPMATNVETKGVVDSISSFVGGLWRKWKEISEAGKEDTASVLRSALNSPTMSTNYAAQDGILELTGNQEFREQLRGPEFERDLPTIRHLVETSAEGVASSLPVSIPHLRGKVGFKIGEDGKLGLIPMQGAQLSTADTRTLAAINRRIQQQVGTIANIDNISLQEASQWYYDQWIAGGTGQ